MADLLSYIERISSLDILQVLGDLNTLLSDWASKLNVPSVIFFSVGLALALVIGIFGYKMIKTIMAFMLGFVGYLVGSELFYVLADRFEKLPDWLVYIAGAIIAILFVCLAFAKTSYAWYTVAAIMGYFIVMFYIEDSLLAIGGAIVLAMIVALLPRVSFILSTSLLAGALCNSFLYEILPSDWVILEKVWVPYTIAFGVALICAIIQFATTRREAEDYEY